MKKRVVLGLFFMLALVSLSACKYYNDTYKGSMYYSVVPNEVPEKTQTVDNNGKEVSGSYSYRYTITWYDAEGNELVHEVEISDANPEPLTPGKYISAEISKKRIVKGPNYIEEGEIPQNALAKIKQ